MDGGLAKEPGHDCPRCPRLVAFRTLWRERQPDWFNAPVPAVGPPDARLAIIGLAPGLRGANRTGRPFTGDYAGELLYATLIQFGFAAGDYRARPDDGLTLIDARIVNAVRCVPPENKPTPEEIRTCRTFMAAELAEMARLRAIVTLGKIAHDSVIAALGGKPSACKFAHGARHDLAHNGTDAGMGARGVAVFDSYHCSRLNTNTGTLTPAMFHAVFAQVRKHIDAAGS